MPRDEERNRGEKESGGAGRGDHGFVKRGSIELANEDHQDEDAVALEDPR